MTVPEREPDTRAVVDDAEIAAGVVCMMCGVSGSGKTTWARALERRGLLRQSVDETVWRRFGRHGVDYDPADYPRLQAAARALLDEDLPALLGRGTPVVLDYSFHERAQRDRYRTVIEAAGRPWRLLVLRPDRETLRRRLAARRRTVDANGAFPMPDAVLDTYLRDFEWPQGEGETLLPT